jgi:hypothetical protein
MKKTFLLFLLVFTNQVISAVSSSPVLIENQVLTIAAVDAQDYDVSNNGELRISNPNTGSTGIINIISETGWVFLDGVLPSQAIASYLSKFRVNGQTAINKTNIRVTNYLRGSVIMAHGISYQPLTVYKDEHYMGEQLKISQYSYYRKAQLGTFDDAISSFKLKRGYMATFAFNEDGTRYSKVYIADNADVNIPVLPEGLNNQVSFIRVFPWRYAGKKGFGYSAIEASKVLKADWYYSWGPRSVADLTDFEFVPMKWNARTVTDANWSDILSHQDVTHLLGFNEPDQAEQANMSVDKQIEMWPKMLESGLRLGAPAVASNYTQLYEFIDRCDALNYRVDFIPMHIYREVSGQTFYNQIKAVYDRTKRPIWITEFNYGGDWTSGNPTLTQVRDRIQEIIQVFDTAGIVERYAVFDFDNFTKNRYVFTEPTTNYITSPMGSMYRDNVAPMAYRSSNDLFRPYKHIPPTNITAVSEGAKIVVLRWKNDGETQSVTIERAPQGTTNFQVLSILSGNAESYTDMVPYNGGFIYRLKTTSVTNEVSSYGTIQITVREFVNVALNKNAYTNSINSSAYTPDKAIDGDSVSAASRWVNVRDFFPSYLTVGLKGMYRINELKLYTGYLGYNTPLTNFNFQYWNGIGWVDIVTETANTNSRYYKKFNEVQTDSVRLYVNAVAEGIIRLYEMEVLGAKVISTGINSVQSQSGFSAYPNPSNGVFNLINGDNSHQIEVYDLRGVCLYKTAFSDKIDLSFLSKGIYFLKTDKNQLTKIVIN